MIDDSTAAIEENTDKKTRHTNNIRPELIHYVSTPAASAAAAMSSTCHAPGRERAAAFAPGEPAATQSAWAAVSSRTNAWPSGLVDPRSWKLFGSTTGVSHPAEVKCAREEVLDDDDDDDDADDDDDEEEELDAKSAARDFSAAGRWVCTPAMSARR